MTGIVTIPVTATFAELEPTIPPITALPATAALAAPPTYFLAALETKAFNRIIAPLLSSSAPKTINSSM